MMGIAFSGGNSRDDSSESSSDVEDISESTSEDEIRYKYCQSHSDSSISDISNDGICLDSNTTDSMIISTVPIKLSLKDVVNIEDQLEVYEKVSLMYLVYFNPQFALNALEAFFKDRSKRVLYQWANQQDTTDAPRWQEKIVEALCIIQNYQILRKLGFYKDDLKGRFLPNQSCTSSVVNKFRKILYSFCEELKMNDVERLVERVKQDFTKKDLQFKNFDASYLELYLLHWECIGYIKTDNLNNLYAILKQMEMDDIRENLLKMIPAVQKTSKPKLSKTVNNLQVRAKPKEEIFDFLLNDTPLTDLVNSESTSTDTARHINHNQYPINQNKPGVCLIINQETFYSDICPEYKHLLPEDDEKLEERTGTKKDRQNLKETFENFGFRLVMCDNLTHIAMLREIREVVESITDESSLFICIMSHGNEGVVYGCNSCKVLVKDIQNLMCQTNLKNLRGKPKVLILQSCQGKKCQKLKLVEDDEDDLATDGPSTATQAVPHTADMLTFWATVPGYGAIRHKRNGSWFIQSLCAKMKDLGNKHHFGDICTTIIDDVTQKKWTCEAEERVMVPMIISSLRKQLFLPPLKQM